MSVILHSKENGVYHEVQMLTRGRQKGFSEPSEGMDAEASLHGCIHGVFRKALLMASLPKAF